MQTHDAGYDNEDGLPSYLGKLTQAPLLTAEEELRLTRAARAGDEESRQRLIESNMRLVINIAKSYKNRQVPLEDLIQEGAIGLMQASERFDPDKGFRFSTYATHWIRQSIGRAIDNKAKAIRLPAHVSQSLRRIEKERSRLLRELGHEPSHEQLAIAIGVTPKKLQILVQSSQDLLSLDMTVGDSNGGTTLGGLLRDTKSIDPEEAVMTEALLVELKRILLELNDKEQKVMQMRYRMGTDPNEIVDQGADEIANELQISRERVRQIELQAIKKLRILAQRRKLRDTLI